MPRGLIHVYTGDGKGKTTAAFGLAIRAAGHGKNVLILQFLKSRIGNSGEIRSAKKAGVQVIKFKNQTSPLFDPSVKKSNLKRSIQKAIVSSIEKIKSGKYDLIIMEEFNNVVGNGYATTGELLDLIREKPEELELVFTGRGAPEELIAIADYVTEVRMVKHPANKGIMARKGIEY
ncbi:MAG: cob(I)yrinic acid a,c-diamide adenosyltransferase [Nitrospirota bacterium]